MAERISACDKVLEKKYIIDIFEDGLVNTIGEVYSKLQK